MPDRRGRRPLTPADLVGADLVRHVLDRAHARRADQVLLTLDPSDPCASAVLEALQTAVGTSVVSLRSRAAGSSVLVDADLLAPPAGGLLPAEGGEDEESDRASLAAGVLVLLR